MKADKVAKALKVGRSMAHKVGQSALDSSIRLKAEWEEQSAIFMAFPHTNSDWARHINAARACFIDIIEHIICFECVILCVDVADSEGLKALHKHFKSNNLAQNATQKALDSRVARYFSQDIKREVIINPISKYATKPTFSLHIVRVETNDTWARDFGAISVEVRKNAETSKRTSNSAKQGNIRLLDFGFNGWGLKFSANFDNAITRKVFKSGLISTKELVLEGGSIDSNGAGVLLTNTQCLLESNRNPHLSKTQIERKLKRYFGLKSLLWLNSGFLAGDDTDSHIDTLARFITPDTIAYIACDEPKDMHYSALKAMESELKALRQPNNKPYKLIKLPFTKPIFDSDKVRLPASYANFLFVNNALLVPIYGDKNDSLALQILAKALPQHKIIGIDCRTLILWHGSLHCVSMQVY